MHLTVEHRFCGPPGSGNGGWTGGALAALVTTTPGFPAVTVRLSAPPPLDRPMRVEAAATDGRPAVRLVDADLLVATATAAPAPDDALPEPATFAQARSAEARYEGRVDHPFSGCYVCGTAHSDGLGLRPGPLGDGTGRYACTWVPADDELPDTWAALDCPGGWSAGIAGRPMVLGTMTARVLGRPEVGVPHVVTAWPRGSRGRLHHSGTMLHAADGRLLAHAEAVWVAVDPAAFGAPAAPGPDSR